MPPSTHDFLAATTDPDLLRRAQATAAMAGVTNPDAWAAANIASICLHNDAAVVDAYAYAASIREQHLAATPPPVGINPGAVTDEMLASAVEALRPPQ